MLAQTIKPPYRAQDFFPITNSDHRILTLHCLHIPFKTCNVICVHNVNTCPFHNLFSSSAKSQKSKIRETQSVIYWHVGLRREERF